MAASWRAGSCWRGDRVACSSSVQITWNWQGGGGFIGNRYFVNVYPAFLFLVTRIRPRWTIPAGYAFAGLFLGPLLFTPFGAGGPEPTLQAHVRNIPFRWLPLELTLRNVPGYHRSPRGLRVVGRATSSSPWRADVGARNDQVEIYLLATADPEGVFQVLTPAPRNRVEIEMGGISRRSRSKRARPIAWSCGPARPPDLEDQGGHDHASAWS